MLTGSSAARTRAEIDFVGRGLGTAVESKYTDEATGGTPRRSRRAVAGVMVSRSVTLYGGGVDMLPAPAVALLLGA